MQPVLPSLARGIRIGRGTAPHTRSRGDDQQHGLAGGRQERRRVLGREKGALQVGVERRVPILLRQLFNRLERPRQNPGRKNRHIEVGGALPDLRDRRGHALFQTHIRGVEMRLAPSGLNLLHRGSAFYFVVIHDVDTRPFLGEKFGSSPTNAGGPASYQRIFVC